jgi:glutamine synthetase
VLEKLHKNRALILQEAQKFFVNSNSLTPKIGCELEFFLLDEKTRSCVDDELVQRFISELAAEICKNFPLIYAVEKERGKAQIEIKTAFTADLSRLCFELDAAKKFIKNFARIKNYHASFAAQPFFDDCGNALQFNLSLYNELDENVFFLDEEMLRSCANSLLAAVDFTMIFLAPSAEDYLRFDFELNKNLFRSGKFSAPVNLSFGANNRTCAIRIPTAQNDKKQKRLEYRLASAEALPELSIAAILITISEAKKSDKNQFEQIFGNAFDEQYQLKNFVKNFTEAQEFFLSEKNFIRKKMEQLLLNFS